MAILDTDSDSDTDSEVSGLSYSAEMRDGLCVACRAAFRNPFTINLLWLNGRAPRVGGAFSSESQSGIAIAIGFSTARLDRRNRKSIAHPEPIGA